MLLSLALPAAAQARGDSLFLHPRLYDKEHPLVYEDAWDLWPYVFLDDDGLPAGFNVELLTLLFNELDIPFEISLKPTSQALEDLRAGRSDLMLGMMADFHDTYTRRYGKSIVHFFTHSVAHPKDSKKTVQTFEDLATQQVIVHEGSFSHHLMENRGWGVNAEAFVDMGLAIQMVSAEDKGQVLWNTMSLKWLIHKYHASNLTLSPVDMPSGEYRFMANDSVLLEKLDAAYTRLKASERLQPLERKWFYPEEAAEHDAPAWLWYVAYIIGAATLILAFDALVYHVRERRATHDGRLRIDRLAMVLNTCKVSIWTYDVEEKVIRWYGDDARTQETFDLKKFARRYRPVEREQLQTAVRRLIDQKSDSETLQMHITDTYNNYDSNHVYRVALSVLKSADGTSKVIIATESDATDEIGKMRKGVELTRRYETVFSTAMVDMVYCDREGYVSNMNERAQRTFRRTLDEVRSEHLNIKAFFPDDDILTYHYATHALTPEGSPLPEGQSPSASTRFYEMQVIPIFDSEQKHLGIYATGREVTEVAHTYVKAKEGIEELRRAHDEVGEYVSNINYVLLAGGVRIATYSPETHVLTIYHRIHETQYTLTQQRCLSLTDQESVTQVMRLMRAMDRRTKGAVAASIRTRLRTKGDERVWLLVQMYPVTDEKGCVTAYEGVCRDITDTKRTERMLKQETEKAQEVEQLKNKFLHNMCYAIYAPLNTVVKSAEMFEKDHDAAEEATCIETIKENSAYLLNLVNDILFLSRLDARMVEMTPRECDFAKTVEALCHNGWLTGRKDEVSYEVENRYDELVLDIDITNLGRIIEQLLRNAVEHTAKGVVRVRYEYIGGKLILGIDDTGPGITKDVLDHVFERFNTPSGKGNSTGLGLPICKELVTQMGGHIDIDSEVGKGTTVWVTIPCEAKKVVRKQASEA